VRRVSTSVTIGPCWRIGVWSAREVTVKGDKQGLDARVGKRYRAPSEPGVVDRSSGAAVYRTRPSVVEPEDNDADSVRLSVSAPTIFASPNACSRGNNLWVRSLECTVGSTGGSTSTSTESLRLPDHDGLSALLPRGKQLQCRLSPAGSGEESRWILPQPFLQSLVRSINKLALLSSPLRLPSGPKSAHLPSMLRQHVARAAALIHVLRECHGTAAEICVAGVIRSYFVRP
jgi:hypothetical protein